VRSQQDGEVRIVGRDLDTVTNGGRVEVYIGADSRWSTICNDGWDIRDADVVCRQLGYPRAIAAVSDSNAFGMGEGRISLSEVNCLGNETMILHCPATRSDINCNHSEDVGVYCFGELNMYYVNDPPNQSDKRHAVAFPTPAGTGRVSIWPYKMYCMYLFTL